ncbi:MAG: hypothetical protein L6R35_004431 [Caloplaca aegaea]|nr:MAG: hypothetical protein L6R35_004431 [Caloplaca aegaea]
MAIISTLISYFAPVFLILSPFTSYTDQILSIHRTRTSAGFSLDIPLIMLTASILKIFYWPGARYDFSLLIQAFLMVGVQMTLLKVALDNRPAWRGERPFVETEEGRPLDFWRWKAQRPYVYQLALLHAEGPRYPQASLTDRYMLHRYWEYLLFLTFGLLILHTLLQPDGSSLYTKFIGYLGLTIEAALALPQLQANYRARSCKGFRVSVLANWLFGDMMKMGYFFASEPGRVPWAFKICGMFQACCDAGLGLQYWMYGEGEALGDLDIRLS